MKKLEITAPSPVWVIHTILNGAYGITTSKPFPSSREVMSTAAFSEGGLVKEAMTKAQGGNDTDSTGAVRLDALVKEAGFFYFMGRRVLLIDEETGYPVTAIHNALSTKPEEWVDEHDVGVWQRISQDNIIEPMGDEPRKIDLGREEL